MRLHHDKTTTVVLLDDIPDKNLRRGQVGTVVEILKEIVFEVEFSDTAGKPYAMLPLKSDQLMMLYHEPLDAAS